MVVKRRIQRKILLIVQLMYSIKNRPNGNDHHFMHKKAKKYDGSLLGDFILLSNLLIGQIKTISAW
jgi:hypothetical protein